MPADSQATRMTAPGMPRVSGGGWRALYDILREKMRKKFGLTQREDRSAGPAVAAIERLRRLSGPDWPSQVLRLSRNCVLWGAVSSVATLRPRC
jgi:hypothetical protein